MSRRSTSATARESEADRDETGWLDSRFRGFSCPQEGLDEAFVALVAATYARETIRLFLDRYNAELTQRGDGLVGLLETWLSSAIAFDPFWDPAVGHALRGIQVGNATDAIMPAAALALRATASGVSGTWSLTLAEPMRLQFDRWLLPMADRIAVACDGKSARIRTASGDASHETHLTRTKDGWDCDGAQALPLFGTPDQRIVLLPADAVPLTGVGALDDPLPVVDDVPPELIGVCQENIALLKDYAPVYLPWVMRVLRYVIPLHQIADIRSGSVADRFGTIYLSLGLNAVTVAESLVHEASHQYLNLLCRLGPVDDGTDDRLYYSPVMRKDRPLSRILVAYHAFANMLLFYRLCSANRLPDDGSCARREAELVSQVAQLEEPLRTNDALTAIGRGLRDPLMERLH